MEIYNSHDPEFKSDSALAWFRHDWETNRWREVSTRPYHSDLPQIDFWIESFGRLSDGPNFPQDAHAVRVLQKLRYIAAAHEGPIGLGDHR